GLPQSNHHKPKDRQEDNEDAQSLPNALRCGLASVTGKGGSLLPPNERHKAFGNWDNTIPSWSLSDGVDGPCVSCRQFQAICQTLSNPERNRILAPESQFHNAAKEKPSAPLYDRHFDPWDKQSRMTGTKEK